MAQLVFDTATATRIEAAYFAGDAVRRRRIVREALRTAPGDRVADVGCGPGFYCAELAGEVGPSGSVAGIDSSPAMLCLAGRRCSGYGQVELHQAAATSLPLGDHSADAAISVQVLEYVADVRAALHELHRVLRPGGRIVVWDIDWATVSLHSQDEPRMRRVLQAWDGHLAHRSLPRTLVPQLRAAGFADVAAAAYAFATTEFDPDSYGFVLVPIIEAFVAGRDGISPEAAHQWAAEQRRLGERGEFYFSSPQFCFTARKPG
jgi:arsenite methyltransferase